MYRGILATVVVIGSLFVTASFAYIVNPGPVVNATVGGVWPRPKYLRSTDNYFLIDPKNFSILPVENTCDILDKAITRYIKIIQSTVHSPIYYPHVVHNGSGTNVTPAQILSSLKVNLTSPCEQKPHLKMDEWYFLSTSGTIISHSIWGVLRALETFSQLVTPYENQMLRVTETHIRDEPRFPHRGLLVDTSRHYISKDILFRILDGMAYNKLNVFHWHIVDDHSFPYVSKKFPELSAKGAFRPEMIYTQKDVADVIEYARIRGIRVIPEFDVPGHTRSWGVSHPEVLTQCEGSYQGLMGPMNPIKDVTYQFIDELFREVQEVFPDQYIHVGGDEVGFECWNSSTEIVDYMKKNNISSFSFLQKNFMEKVTRSVTALDNIPIVWQEVMVENVDMPPGTIVQVWTGDWRVLLFMFTKAGHRALMSECWYLDHLENGGDWKKYYNCEPLDFIGSEEQKKLILGGEACMWAEVVSDRNILQRIFPRSSAAAERLWSPQHTRNFVEAQQRLEEHVCRMNLRGIPAQPANGPGIC